MIKYKDLKKKDEVKTTQIKTHITKSEIITELIDRGELIYKIRDTTEIKMDLTVLLLFPLLIGAMLAVALILYVLLAQDIEDEDESNRL